MCLDLADYSLVLQIAPHPAQQNIVMAFFHNARPQIINLIQGQFVQVLTATSPSLVFLAFSFSTLTKSQSSHTVCKIGLGHIELELCGLLISRDVGSYFLTDEARVYGDALRNGAEALLVVIARDRS